MFVQGDGITRAGAVPFGDGLTAMQANSAAGGMNTFARRSNVVLMRREKGAWKGYTLDLRPVFEGEDFTNDVQLQRDDIVYIPRKRISNVNLFVEQWIQNNIPVPPIVPAL